MNFKKWLNETLALKGNYKGSWFQKLVAASYKLSPNLDPNAIPAFEDLSKKVLKQDKILQSKYQAEPTLADPYKSMKQMTREIEKQKLLGIKKPLVKVFSEPPEQGHPVFSNELNVKLRWIHDIIAHYFGQHPFSARGEYGAYNRHLKTLCNVDQVKAGQCLAAKALFTEIVAQTSYYYIYGGYTVQKVIILNDFDHFRVGQLNPNSKLNDFFVVVGKELVPRGNLEGFNQVFPELSQELNNFAETN